MYKRQVQSQRQASGIYLEYAKMLVEKGEAYYCFCTPERLAKMCIRDRDYTSHDVVARLRGILKQKKIGHTGTLDPRS